MASGFHRESWDNKFERFGFVGRANRKGIVDKWGIPYQAKSLLFFQLIKGFLIGESYILKENHW